MKAVILAAGICSRIREVTQGMPKCLLRFGDRTILDHQLDSLIQAGITSIIIVVGYRKEQIISHVARNYAERNVSISFVENPRFAVTNNIYSLWLAWEQIGNDDFICLNADVLFHPDIIRPALNIHTPIAVIVDKEWRDETMKVVIRDGRVTAMSKAITREQFSGTYANITIFARRIVPAFFATMGFVIAEGRDNVFFNVAVERLIARGVRVSSISTRGLPWAEVDDPSDYWFAQNYIYPQLINHTANYCLLPRQSTVTSPNLRYSHCGDQIVTAV